MGASQGAHSCSSSIMMKVVAFVLVLAAIASSAPTTSPDAVVEEQISKNTKAAQELSEALKGEPGRETELMADEEVFPASSYDANFDSAFAEATSSLHGLPMHVKKELAKLGVSKYKKQLTPSKSWKPSKHRHTVVTKVHKKKRVAAKRVAANRVKHIKKAHKAKKTNDDVMMNSDEDVSPPPAKSSSARTAQMGSFVVTIAAVLVAQRF